MWCCVGRWLVTTFQRWTSSGNSQTNFCRLWKRYESAKYDEVVLWILRRKDWCSRRIKSGRPSLISDDLLQKIEGEILADRRVTVRVLHQIVPEVSKTTIHEAVTVKLRYRKLCASWVPKMLKDNHKTKGKYSRGIYWTIRCTFRTSPPAISSCFFT